MHLYIKFIKCTMKRTTQARLDTHPDQGGVVGGDWSDFDKEGLPSSLGCPDLGQGLVPYNIG